MITGLVRWFEPPNFPGDEDKTGQMETSPRILIVEDDAVLAADLQGTLIQLGYQVSGLAATGEEAIQLALEQKPDAVLLDIRLWGEMTGIQAAEEIHKHLDLPVVYLSAYTDDFLIQQAKTTDAYAYLSKPVRSHELRTSLEMALYKHRIEQHVRHLNLVLRAVRDVNQLITRERNVRSLLEEACKILLRTRGYRFVWIGQPEGDILSTLVCAGEGKNLITHIMATVTPEQGRRLPGTEASYSRKVVACHDMLHDERYAPWRDEVAAAQFFSTVAVPILYEEDLYGVLIVYADQVNLFKEEEVDLLFELAGDIAFGLKTIADETERKKAEDALRESEKSFRNLSDNALAGVYIIQDGLYSYVNPAMARIFGYTSDELIGAEPKIIIDPEDVDRVTESKQRRINGEISTAHYEFRGRCKNGEPRQIEVLGARVDINGRPAIMGNILDITERNRVEQALQQSREQLQAVVQTANEAIITMDMQQKIVFWNRAAERIFGYSEDEMLGSPITRIVPSQLRRQNRQATERFFSEGQRFAAGKTMESMGLNKEGKEFPVEMSFAEWKTQSGMFVTAIIWDISERKSAEDRIQLSERKYRELFQVNKDGISIFFLMPDGTPSTFIELNDAAHKMLGYSKEQMLQLTPDMLEPELTPEEMRPRQSELASKGLVNFETVLAHQDGHRIFAEFTSQFILYEGKPAIMNIVRDITERKQHERELLAITDLSAALRTAASRAAMLPVIVDQLSKMLGCDLVSIEMIDPITQEAVVEAAHGAWTSMVGWRKSPGAGMNTVISEARKPHPKNDLEDETRISAPGYSWENIHAGSGAPLIAQDKLIGYLWIGRDTDIAESDVRIFSAVADIAANAIHRATLHDQTLHDAAELALAYDSTLEGWAHALELRDQETEGHTRRVVQMTLDLARAMGIHESEMENIRRGALLHDIGKMGIPDSVLLKPGTLNDREWEIMRRHPEYARDLLAPIDFLRKVIDIPYRHHEKWDGSGYPLGLNGDDIPLTARIFAISDVWDALTSDRPYRKAWSEEQALKYIREQSGRHFDPRVVDAFFRRLDGT